MSEKYSTEDIDRSDEESGDRYQFPVAPYRPGLTDPAVPVPTLYRPPGLNYNFNSMNYPWNWPNAPMGVWPTPNASPTAMPRHPQNQFTLQGPSPIRPLVAPRSLLSQSGPSSADTEQEQSEVTVKPKARRKWSEEQVRFALLTWEEGYEKINSVRKKEAWEEIAIAFNTRFPNDTRTSTEITAKV